MLCKFDQAQYGEGRRRVIQSCSSHARRKADGSVVTRLRFAALYLSIHPLKLCLTPRGHFPSDLHLCISPYTRTPALHRREPSTVRPTNDKNTADQQSKKAEPFGLRRRAIQSSYKPHKRINASDFAVAPVLL
jgi:hypothetical protein